MMKPQQAQMTLYEYLLPMNPKIKRGIERIGRLDRAEREHMKDARAIAYSMPAGQPPPCYERALNKAIKVSEQKAAIWNGIRNYLIPGPPGGRFSSRTLWQIAIAARMPVGRWGSEHHLDFTADDIKVAISRYLSGELEL